jgi:hypothetical protein
MSSKPLKALPVGVGLKLHASGQRSVLSLRGDRALLGGSCDRLGPLALARISGIASAASLLRHDVANEGQEIPSVSAVCLSHCGAFAFVAEPTSTNVGCFSADDLNPMSLVSPAPEFPSHAIAISPDDKIL